jgi:hypothetical protein
LSHLEVLSHLDPCSNLELIAYAKPAGGSEKGPISANFSLFFRNHSMVGRSTRQTG